MLIYTALAVCIQMTQPIRLTVDAREITRGLYHVTEQFRAEPGKLTLWYPKWLPGYHGPGGPLNNNIAFRIKADGKTLPWQRDLVEVFQITTDVPSGARQIEIEFTQANSRGSAHLARVDWNELIWYPSGKSDDTLVQANLLLPENWTTACALHSRHDSADQVEFETASLTRLVDSPAEIGRFYKQFDVSGSSSIKHYLDLMADTPEALNASPQALSHIRRIHEEMEAISGSAHYREYHWLLTLSDNGAEAGLEHHESSEDGTGSKGLTDSTVDTADLLSHEYFHSYNGKFRRPEGLCTPDYQKPMKDDLLWVYEGLTQFMGHLLACRSGWWTQEQWREQIALAYVEMNTHRGREWRPVVDTAVITAGRINDGRQDATWSSAIRMADYYVEMTIVWLEVDMRIRELTQGKRSLLDFLRIFYGGPSNGPELRPYSFHDVVSALNQVARYDWGALLKERVYQVQPDLSQKAFELAGWKLVHNDKPNIMMGLLYGSKGGLMLATSIGTMVGSDGTVQDVVPGYPCDKAGLSPGMKIVSVNGNKYSDDALKQAVKVGGTIDLIVSYKEDVRKISVPYNGGLRIPHLERIPDRPNRFEELLKPFTK